MNKDILKGKWMQIRGDVKKHWGMLTDDDLTQIDGDHDKLVGRLQERYGYTRERAEQEINQFDKTLGTNYPPDTNVTHSH